VAHLRDALEEGVSRLREAGSESARLDAELLLAHALGVERTAILAHPEAPLGDGQVETFRAFVERRASGEPVAYIRGLKEFYGLSFAVDSRALIPRPETERLVELALAQVVTRLTASARPPGTPPVRVIDVGTGSGAVVVTMAVVLRRGGFGRDVALMATDVSDDALALAVENAVAHGVADLIDARPADLLEGTTFGGPFDVIVANLPYVPASLVPRLPVAASFEPSTALDGGADGLDVIRRFLPAIPEALTDDGVVLLEIGSDQADAVVDYAEQKLPGWDAFVHADLSGAPRVVALSPPGASFAADPPAPTAQRVDGPRRRKADRGW
jgi:release factor glutamine methyltransferase